MLRKEFGGVVECWKLHDASHSGYPDLVLNVMGSFAAIELKRPGVKRVEPIQDYFLSRVAKTNGHATVARSVEEVRDFVTKILQKGR